MQRRRRAGDDAIEPDNAHSQRMPALEARLELTLGDQLAAPCSQSIEIFLLIRDHLGNRLHGLASFRRK